MPGPSYTVHTSPSGNVFMAELAALLVRALGDLGRDAELRHDVLPERRPGHIDLVVAPHEFFTLQRGVAPERLRAAADAAVCVGTEQPGTPWFDLSAGWAGAGPLTLDINPLAVDRLRRRGIDARLLRLGYHESWDRTAAHNGRPTEVLFLGALTPRRDELLSTFGPALAERECDLRLFEFDRPASAGTPGFLVGEDKYDRLATAKVLLNIHRSEVQYFEWMRALEAIANGCVLVTEPAEGMAPLVADRHVVVASGHLLIGEVERLLAEDDRRQAIAEEARSFAQQRLHFTRLLEAQLPALERAVAEHRPRRVPDVAAIARIQARRAARAGRALAVRGRDGVLRRLQHPADPLEARRNEELARQVKRLALANRRVERRLESLDVERRFGRPDHLEVHATSAYAGAEPEVTVVIPLFDYEDEVPTAIASVLASRDVAFELLVVDDHSRDGSLEVALDCLAAHDDVPMAVLAKLANAGLSAARNTGFEHARADRVFLLDADNAVYPRGLRKLSDALDADPDAAFAFGIIERYGDDRDLLSALPWDPARLTTGNYIDAMAMVRVDAWRKAGGYDPEIDGRFGGWEDYELWLHFAALGMRGTHVRQIVARYHAHTGSMLGLLNLETDSLRAELRGRYPDLPWPAPPAVS